MDKFDVTNYLRENAFGGNEYSLFEDKNGGLFERSPVETPREETFSRDSSKLMEKYLGSEDFAAYDKKGYDNFDNLDNLADYPFDLEALTLQEDLSLNEMEWLEKSEDDIRNKIFELAEEIQRETKMMYSARKSLPQQQLRAARKSESVSDASPCHQGRVTRSRSNTYSPEKSPALSSYVPQLEDDRVSTFNLDSTMRPREYAREYTRSRSPQEERPSRAYETCQPVRSNRMETLTDWRVAARNAEQNANRSENALGGGEDRQAPIGAKRRLCRHFLKGFCNRGDTCDFLHDNSIFCPDEQKVFLGGLPTHITADSLCTALKEMNYTVINKPKILRGFTPQVCLSSIAEAQELIRMKKIYVDNTPVDVRPYEDRKPPDDLKRSVFLGGLAADTTVEDIKTDLARAGFPVENNPILKAGFVPQVVLESVDKAQELIKLAKIRVRNKLADVRPYVNFRKRY